VGVTRNDITNRSRPWDCVLQLIPPLYSSMYFLHAGPISMSF